MRNIGIDTSEGLVYELDGLRGHPVWPIPVITRAKFVYPSQDPIEADTTMNISGYRFREDSFEPTSRIRRGRFYRWESSQNCIVANHPARSLESAAPDVHARSKQCNIIHGELIWQNFLKGKREKPLVLLGVDERFTVWSIVNIEAISTGEDLVTLKGSNSFGLLPSLNEDKVPEKLRAKLVESLDTFADEIHRSSPTSVVDRARDVATYGLLAYLGVQSADSKDLGTLIRRLEGKELVVASSSATIINRLHARGKAVEQEKRDLQPIREADAELVTHCVGNLLCELGMAEGI